MPAITNISNVVVRACEEIFLETLINFGGASQTKLHAKVMFSVQSPAPFR